jgi:hypothetical protein
LNTFSKLSFLLDFLAKKSMNMPAEPTDGPTSAAAGNAVSGIEVIVGVGEDLVPAELTEKLDNMLSLRQLAVVMKYDLIATSGN